MLCCSMKIPIIIVFSSGQSPLLKFYLRPWQTRTHRCGQIDADTNVSPFARGRNICCRHKFCFRYAKMFLILLRNILCLQQMFPSSLSPRTIMGNNVSATKCSRLPGPLNSGMYNDVPSVEDFPWMTMGSDR